MYENSEIWEGQFIEVTEIAKNKYVVIGNIQTPCKYKCRMPNIY